MKESEALVIWNKLKPKYRYALMQGTCLDQDSGVHWSQLSQLAQERLLNLDWNFMLGGKLEIEGFIQRNT